MRRSRCPTKSRVKTKGLTAYRAAAARRDHFDPPTSRAAPTIATGKKAKMKSHVVAVPETEPRMKVSIDPPTPVVRPPFNPRVVSATNGFLGPRVQSRRYMRPPITKGITTAIATTSEAAAASKLGLVAASVNQLGKLVKGRTECCFLQSWGSRGTITTHSRILIVHPCEYSFEKSSKMTAVMSFSNAVPVIKTPV